MTKARVQRIKTARKGARVIELWDTSHVVFLSNPNELQQGMTEFIESLSGQGIRKH
jgi:hypothetical protein